MSISRAVAVSLLLCAAFAGCNRVEEAESRPEPVVQAALASAPPLDTKAACEACAQTNCKKEIDACKSAEGKTASGKGKGELCQAVLACVSDTNCATALEPEACYCGKGVDIDTCLKGTVKGACKAIVEEGAESTKPAEVGARFVDSQYATGNAFRFVRCEGQYCRRECFGS